MIRWVAVAVMFGLVGAGAAGWLAPAAAEPGVDAAVWRAAGIVPFPR